MKKHRSPSALAISALAALLAVGACGKTPDKLADCRQLKDLDLAIAGCSEAIQAGSKDAQVYVNRGFAYFRKNDDDHAFADYEEAIRLDPKSAPAFAQRGVVFRDRGDDDRAIADFNKAADLGINEPRLLLDRGMAYLAKGETAKSIADFSTAIERDADKTFDGQIGHLTRGIAYLYDGAPDKAQADFRRAVELNPKAPHFAIWLHIAERRMGSTGDVASAPLLSAMGNFDTTKWPAPVIRMFLGEETPAAVLASDDNKGMTCEADFYVAEYMYLQNQKDEALRLYKAALQDCRRVYFEAVAANAALRSLGADP